MTNTSTVQQIQTATTASTTNPKPDPVWRRAVPRIYDDFTKIDADSYGDRYRAWRNAGSNPAAPPDTTDMSLTTDSANWNICTDHRCAVIECEDLRNWGYLPVTESCTNPLGQQYNFIIRKEPFPGTTGPTLQYALDAIVAITNPVTDTNNKVGKYSDVGSAWTFAKGMPDKNVAVTDNATASAVAGIPASTPAGNIFTAGEIVAFGKATKDGINPGKLGWFARGEYWGYPGGWPDKAIVVARAGYWSDNPNGVYYRRSGELPLTGPMNTGGNYIYGLKKVKLGDPCDADPAKAAAMVGAVAQLEGEFDDPASTTTPKQKLGAGYRVACAWSQPIQGYVWTKSTAGPTTIEDAQAGMLDSYETSTQWTCWPNLATRPAVVNYHGLGLAPVKFVMSGGKIYTYGMVNDGTQLHYQNITLVNPGPASPGDKLGWDSPTPVYGLVPVVETKLIGTTAQTDWNCKFPANYNFGNPPADPYFQVLTQWVMSSNEIKYVMQGSWAAQVGRANFNIDPMYPPQTNEDLSGIPVTVNGTVPSTTCTTDALGNTSCSTVNVPISLSGTTAARAGDVPFVWKPFNQTIAWSWQKQFSRCKPNAALDDTC